MIEEITQMEERSNKALQEGVESLATMTRAHIIEGANSKLHSRREMYINGLHQFPIDENTMVISLDANVRWIDDGEEPFEMLPGLLASSSAKTALDGSKYLRVPFKHGPQGAASSTPAQSTLLATVKAELKKKKIPYAKIEKDANGMPKLGLLHKLDVKTVPNIPGRKWWETDRPAAGPNGMKWGEPGESTKTGTPYLKGIRIYQHLGEGGVAKRSIMTFRTASSKHPDKWHHPGVDKIGLFEEAETWALDQWEKLIVPKILNSISEKS
jgi:hypothetical protein